MGTEEPKSALGLGLGIWLGGSGGVDAATECGDGALALAFPPGGATTGSALPGCCDEARLGWLGCRTCPSTVGSAAGGAGELDGEDVTDGSGVEVEPEDVPSGTVTVGVVEPSGTVSVAVEVPPCDPVADVPTCPDSTAAARWAPLYCGQHATATAISARIGAARANVLTAGDLLTGAARVRRQRVPWGSLRLTRESSLIS